MANPTNYVRGAIVKCHFPYEERPDLPGHKPHYCLFIAQYQVEDVDLLALCYGTSRMDSTLLAAHSHALLSVPSKFVRASMPGPVTHFLCDRVAFVPTDWVNPSFKARLDFVRPEQRAGDQQRTRLYEKFCAFEGLLEQRAASALDFCLLNRTLGLPTGQSLR